jgi:peptidoglycan/LPS O-acetylase OafA/YrhL
MFAYSHPELVNTHYLYMRTEFRFDAVAFGVLLAALCETPRARPLLVKLAHPASFAAAVMIGLAAITISDDYFANVWRYAVLGPAIVVAMVGLIFSARFSFLQFFLNLPIATWVGRLSYSLYIWHLPAQALAWSVTTGVAAIGLSAVLSVTAAAASYYGIERPMNRFRRRFGSRAES